MKILYTGLFVDSRELHEKIKNIPGAKRLERLVENPHVTLWYYRDGHKEIPTSEYGRIVDIRIVGYANDGSNEGVKIELTGIDRSNGQDKLSGIVDDNKTHHITISLGPDAKAVDTGMLDFVPIEPIELTGIFGVFCEDYSKPFCGSPSNAFLGKYIVPFSISPNKDGKAVELGTMNWKPKKVNLRYLASYIREVFSSDNGIVRAYSLSEDSSCEFLNGYKGKTFIIDGQEDKRYEISLNGVEVYSFATGICFLVVSVGFDPYLERNAILELSSILSFMFRVGNIDEGLNSTNEKTKLACNIMKLVTDGINRKVEWFPSAENKKCNALLRYVSDTQRDDDYEMAYRLSRGFKDSAYVSRSVSEDITRKVYTPIDDRFWMIDSNAIAVFSYLDKNSDINFIRNAFPANVDNYYFHEYLLALHEREGFLIYNTRAVKNWNNMKELIKLKREILQLDIWSTYNAVSTDSYYQELYDKLYKELRLEQLESDVEEVVSKAKEYDDDIKEKRTNSMLTAIGLLAIFSALIDGTDFVWKICEPGKENLLSVGHIIVYFFVVGAFVYGLVSCFKKK